MRSRPRARIASSCWTTPRRRRIARTSGATTLRSSSIGRFDRRFTPCELKTSSTTGYNGSTGFDGSADRSGFSPARWTPRPGRRLPCPRMAENEGSAEDDRLRERDGMAGGCDLRRPLQPPRIFRGPRAHPGTAHPNRGLPVRPRDDCDHGLLDSEAEEEIRLGIRTRRRIRRVCPRPRAPGTRRLVPRPDSRPRLEAVDLLRELEVQVREAALVVCRQREPNGRPRVVNVRVVVHRLRQFADLVDEPQRLGEVFEFPCPADRFLLPRPPRDFLQPSRNLRLGEEGPSRHVNRAPPCRHPGKGLGEVQSTLFKVN